MIADRLGAPLTIVHVCELDDRERRQELEAELANVGALLGRDVRVVSEQGGAAARIVAAAEGAGLVGPAAA
jgi:hypothetical protein